ncbi:C40 family peptidase [Methylobacillus rhizosphaerae]|nr:C40 family peptidase [Methylobacillus rhizosphaerae]
MMKFHAFLLCVAFLVQVPAQAAESDVRQSAPEKSEAIPSWANTAQEVLINALSLTGIKYRYGGKSPETGFDCSGFVRYVFQQATSMTLPHGAKAISQLGQPVNKEQLQPGDLVFFNTLRTTFSHVGIYVGNHKFIHAPSSGGSVQIVDMSDTYWAKRFNGARRMETQLHADSSDSH